MYIFKSLIPLFPSKKDTDSVLIMNKEDQNRQIAELLIPETELERQFIANPDYVEGLFWGKPRYGHPEGKVILHIREVLNNIERIPNLKTETRRKLRIITFIHDTFKYKEHEMRKIAGRKDNNHHAFLAAQFLNNYVSDSSLVRLVQLHDEAYYCWKLLRFHQMDHYKKKLNQLLLDLGDDLQLYYLFFKCDTKTGDKNQEPLQWFEREIEGIEVVEF